MVSLDAGSLSPGVPILLIEGEAYGPDEVVGYALADASAGEEAELRRGGYSLALAADPEVAGHFSLSSGLSRTPQTSATGPE